MRNTYKVSNYISVLLSNFKSLHVLHFNHIPTTNRRFEHSLGVAHLAEMLVKLLQKNQPELGIDEHDVLAVKISGLCHDLGHGPFSHVFDGVFIKKMHPNGIDDQGNKWKHEIGSVEMFQHILSKNDIKLSDYGLNEEDKLFVEEIIGGVSERLSI